MITNLQENLSEEELKILEAILEGIRNNKKEITCRVKDKDSIKNIFLIYSGTKKYKCFRQKPLVTEGTLCSNIFRIKINPDITLSDIDTLMFQ